MSTLHTPSTPEQVAEFRSLLDALKVEYAHRDGWQRIKCWNHNAHRRDDRVPSARVRIDTCGWTCHACGIKGGLVGLREWVPEHRRPTASAGHAQMARLRPLAALGGDPLRHVPPDAIDALRRRTGRHLRDGVLRRNLRRVLAAVLVTIEETERTSAVRFTQTDAHRLGINTLLWRDVLPLLTHLGVVMTVGESGRHLRAVVRAQDQGRRLRATTITLREMPLCTYSDDADTGAPSLPTPGVSTNRAPGLTVACSWATRAPRRDVGLGGSPALAALLIGLATGERVRPAADGSIMTTTTATLADLVAVHGPQARRTVRKAAALGLVNAMHTHPHHALVTLTGLGAAVIERDTSAGRARCAAQADALLDRWHAHLQRVREARPGDPDERRRRSTTPDPIGPLRATAMGLVNVITGEVEQPMSAVA